MDVCGWRSRSVYPWMLPLDLARYGGSYELVAHEEGDLVVALALPGDVRGRAPVLADYAACPEHLAQALNRLYAVGRRWFKVEYGLYIASLPRRVEDVARLLPRVYRVNPALSIAFEDASPSEAAEKYLEDPFSPLWRPKVARHVASKRQAVGRLTAWLFTLTYERKHDPNQLAEDAADVEETVRNAVEEAGILEEAEPDITMFYTGAGFHVYLKFPRPLRRGRASAKTLYGLAARLLAEKMQPLGMRVEDCQDPRSALLRAPYTRGRRGRLVVPVQPGRGVVL